MKLTRDSTDDKTVLESRKWFASFLVVYEGFGGKPPEPLPEYDSKRLVSYWQITSNFARTYIRAMLTWHSHTSKSREKWPGICRECKSLWIICFLLNIVVVELVWGEEFEWPYICERQHTICRSDIELFKRDNVLPLTIYTVRYVQCATTPNSKQPKRKVFDFGYFMLMLLCFLIHLVWNSWHIFRCTLQIIVVHRLGSVIVFHVFLSSVSLLSRSQRPHK